ncbi:heterokaryon incompatibility protein-domain-containing protein [Paraphoma chrysanthemicola]|uniref:Heterokaryon incompatibility protein-domain-containing protein n=1 Tax=Paraphoma chrysanthemicola TaxID=798071 RepID=A0A8K0VY77_9PLEO|nr:heterokaryon incompatibility protein-domain-containing protein [Paraphoma chrysanthemicola]
MCVPQAIRLKGFDGTKHFTRLSHLERVYGEFEPRERREPCDHCSFLERFQNAEGTRRSPTSFIRFPLPDTSDEIVIDANAYSFNGIIVHVNRAIERHQSDHIIKWSSPSSGLVDRINWALLRTWLNRTTSAGEQDRDAPGTNHQQLTNIRVLDVRARCVVHLPCDAKYAALSYVWGNHDHTDHLQLQQSNLARLEISGSLDRFALPRAISDALEACNRLGMDYLWVDRLCIVQDSSLDAMALQLDQMGSIYRRASFTIVAAAGEDADFGLPGVSEPRPSKNSILAFADVILCQGPMSGLMMTRVRRSKWFTRAWTFQELQASSKCLFFTHDGVYFLKHSTEDDPVTMEGNEPIGQCQVDQAPRELPLQTTNYVDSVVEFTKRNLTYPEDILRAFSGYLETIYPSRTAYGLPWSDFDRALLWNVWYEPEPGLSTVQLLSFQDKHLPSWSWISSTGWKTFFNNSFKVFGLALWCRVQNDGDKNSSDRRLVVAEPVEADASVFGPANDNLQVVFPALAWLEGCVPTPPPRDLVINCSRGQYQERLDRKWRTCASYWQDAFGATPLKTVFSATNIEHSVLPGRLLVHSQRARFTLDPSQTSKREFCYPFTGVYEGCTRYHIRNAAGRLIGNVLCDPLPEHASHDLGSTADFLALSTCTDTFHYAPPMQEQEKWSNNLYNCPCRQCSAKSIDMQHRSESSATAFPHFEECPAHPGFSKPLPNQRELDEWCGNYKRYSRWPEIQRHFASVSYHDAEGRLMHDWYDVPKLWVMLIVPSTGKGKDDGIYQRRGIGLIYLKRWVEAKPKFKSLVLE